LFSASTGDWIRFGGFFLGIVLFIAAAEKTRVVLGWPPEVNRKLVHVLTGVLIFFTPFFFQSNRPLIWMAVLFIVVNYMGVRSGKLKGMHDTRRRSYGTVFYPMTFLFLVISCWQSHKVVLMLSMLILALADAAAAIMGENLKRPHEYYLGRDKKSWEGSLVMFITTFAVVCIGLPFVGSIDGFNVGWSSAGWIALITAVVATALEALSSSGSDNLTAPLGAAFVLSFMLSRPTVENIQLSIGLGLALLVALLSSRARFLTPSGSVGTFLLATLIFGVGGWVWALPILTFFLISSLLSKVGKAHKTQFGLMFEKSSRRDIGQVLANGAVAGLIVVLYNYDPNPIWFVVYLGALAAVNSDTWATEIGVFSPIPPRSIRTLRQVLPGSSGGVTLLGLFSGLIGSAVIVFIGWLVASGVFISNIVGRMFWIIVTAGLLGSIVDSVLGATLQAQYQCPSCHKITEKKVHCTGEATQLVSGYAWLNNDWVNFFCSSSGALFSWVGAEVFIK